jgi:hypothetical protein
MISVALAAASLTVTRARAGCEFRVGGASPVTLRAQ